MQPDTESARWAVDVAARHLSKTRNVSFLNRADGTRLMKYPMKTPMPDTDEHGVMCVEIRAFRNPFNSPEYEYDVDDDSPIDESTGQPVPTERLLQIPPLICFHAQNWNLYRAVFGRSLEVILHALDELESDVVDQLESDESEGVDE